MVVLHPDSPLRCTECGNKQLTVTFSKNPQSSTFKRWFVLCSRKSEHEAGKVWFGVWKKDQPPRDYPVQPSDYTPSTSIQAPAPKAASSRLPCTSPFCNKISSITCPRQFCASDCRRGPGGPCTTHTVKPSKRKTTVSVLRPSTGIPSPHVSSDDEELALAIKASLQPSTSHQSARSLAPSSSRLQSPSSPVGHSDASPSSTPSSSQPLPTKAATKPRISSQMGPAWQEKLHASSKAVVEREERAERQAKLQQALKENLNITFFDKNDEPGRQLALQGSKDMPDFPWVKPEEFIHRFGSNITTIDHRTAIGRWVELGRLDIVYKVSNNETLIFRRHGVHRMPGIDDEVGQTLRPPPPVHFFKSMSSQRTQVRKEKKAREECNATMGSGRRSAFLSMPPSPCSAVSYLTAATANCDDSSSDIEVSEIEDLYAPMKRARESSTSRENAFPFKRIKDGSSDIEVSEVTHRNLNKRTRSRYESHMGAFSYIHAESSRDVDPYGSSILNRSSSPMIVDSQDPSMFEAPPYMHPRPPSSDNSDLPPSSPLPYLDEQNDDTNSSLPSSLPSLPSQSLNLSRPKKDVTWHHGLYCVDVVNGFERMGSKSLKGLSKAERFNKAFPGRHYADSTVRDAQKQWTRASNSAKETALAYGRSSGGLWRVFSAQHPIKNRKSNV